MKQNKSLLPVLLLLVGIALLVVGCQGTTTEVEVPVEVTRVVKETVEVPMEVTKIVEVIVTPEPGPAVPYLEQWTGSGHADITGEAFRHWDTDGAVPASCAKCHVPEGYLDFLGADGSEAGKVDAETYAPSQTGITCVMCHDPAASALTSVTFPSGVEVVGQADTARCMVCHQGRESKVSVDAKIAAFGEDLDPDAVPAPYKNAAGNDVNLSFSNVHYFAAAATLFGGQAQGGYQYDGKSYDWKNDHVSGYDTCIGCHNPHTLEVKVEQCAFCHEGVEAVEDLKDIRMVSSNPDYDGDGDVEEGMFYEIAGLQELLLAKIQEYAVATAGAEIKYDGATYPYFMGADGANFPNWTPRLLKAAYNYQVSIKDPGAFAHGNKYIVQLLFDSIEDLGGDVTALARTDAGHFAGDTMPFRDWDDSGIVPFGCVKCHTATGMPAFIKNGGSVVVTSSGSTVVTGVGSMPSSNGFQCSTCHNEEAWPERYAVAQVTFPSGKTVSFAKDADGKNMAVDANLCILCHMGRESTTSVNNALKGKDVDTVDKAISFKNIHYFAAGATMFGTDVKGAYEYEGKTYVGVNLHGPNDAEPMNQCTTCHDVHALEVKVEDCKVCHGSGDPKTFRISETDFDGDGDVTEGIASEIDTLIAALYVEIQKYSEAAGTPLLYDSHSYPYFFVDADKDGAPDKNDTGANVRFSGFSPRLLKAAFNFQYAQKDPGAFTHNPMYVLQFLYDSIEDLGGDVTTFVRPEVPAE